MRRGEGTTLGYIDIAFYVSGAGQKNICSQYSLIMIDQKKLENVECFRYLGSVLTNEG